MRREANCELVSGFSGHRRLVVSFPGLYAEIIITYIINTNNYFLRLGIGHVNAFMIGAKPDNTVNNAIPQTISGADMYVIYEPQISMATPRIICGQNGRYITLLSSGWLRRQITSQRLSYHAERLRVDQE